MPSRQRLIQLTRRVLVFAFYFLLLSNVLARSTVPPGDQHERIRAFARDVEFNFVTWTLDAVGLKFGQIALGVGEYIPQEGRSQTVLDYLDLIRRIVSQEIGLPLLIPDDEDYAAMIKNVVQLRAADAG